MKMRLSIEETAKQLDLPKQTLRIMIQNGCFEEFAKVTKIGNSKHYTYYINAQRFYNYLKSLLR